MLSIYINLLTLLVAVTSAKLLEIISQSKFQEQQYYAICMAAVMALMMRTTSANTKCDNEESNVALHL